MCVVFYLCLFFKCALVKSADGADEGFGKIFPFGAGGDAVFGIAYSGIVFIAAGANVFHSKTPFTLCYFTQNSYVKFWEFQEPFFKKVLGGVWGNAPI